jgi:hypothetical protein
MKSNFNECSRDYLEAVAGFPNIGNQLIFWLRTAKKPALMPMHKFMRRQVQLLSYLKGDYLHQTMDVPMAQEKSEQIFFLQPKVHQTKFANLNKTVPTVPLKLIAFFEQCQVTNNVAGILEKIAKDENQPKEGIWPIFMPCVAVNQATIIIAVTSTVIAIKATDAITTIADLTIIIEAINAMIVVNTTTRMQRATSPTTRRMIAGAISPPRKKRQGYA